MKMHTDIVSELLGKIKEAAASERNMKKKEEKHHPVLSFTVAIPHGWTKLFGYDFNRYLDDPHFYVEQTLKQYLWSWENINDDNPIREEIPVWFGHYPEYTFFDLSVQHDSMGIPLLQSDHPISKEPNIKLLKQINFNTSGWMQKILRRYDELNEIIQGRLNVTPMIKSNGGTHYSSLWFRGGLDIAIQLRGYDNFIYDTIERPQFVHDLMKFITEQRINWYESFYHYFGINKGPISLGDDWLNVPFITPNIFEEFILPHYLELEKHHGGIGWVHSCGNQTELQPYMLNINTLKTYEVSPWTDLKQSVMNLPKDKHLLVYIHPTNDFHFTPDKITEKLSLISEICTDRNYSILGSALFPYDDDINNCKYLSQINSWLSIARQICR